MIDTLTQRKWDRRSNTGNVYVEYFIAAAAMAAAAIWFFQSGSYQGVRNTINGRFTFQMERIGGPVQ